MSRRWISTNKRDLYMARCSTHRDRNAIAVLQRPKKQGRGGVNLRFYCQECLDRKRQRDPEIRVGWVI